MSAILELIERRAAEARLETALLATRARRSLAQQTRRYLERMAERLRPRHDPSRNPSLPAGRKARFSPRLATAGVFSSNPSAGRAMPANP